METFITSGYNGTIKLLATGAAPTSERRRSKYAVRQAPSCNASEL